METSTGQMRKIEGVKLYDVPEIAKMLGISTKTVLRLIADGKLPGRKLGKAFFVSAVKLKEFIESSDTDDDDEDDSSDDENSQLEECAIEAEPQDSSRKRPYLSIEQVEGEGQTEFKPGVVLKLPTPYFWVSYDGSLVPVVESSEGVEAYWKEDADLIAEAFYGASDDGDDSDEEDSDEEDEEDDSDEEDDTDA